MELKKLQNGSDIRGIGIEGIEGQHVNLTDEAVRAFGAAFAKWLVNDKKKEAKDLRVLIGRDSRLSGERIRTAFAEGLNSEGVQVFDTGLGSTPAMFMSTVTEGYEFDGAVMVTASHLPFNRNGLKFFTNKGGFGSGEVKELIAIAEELGEIKAEAKATQIDFMSVYGKTLRDKIIAGTGMEKPFAGMKIVVDAGNGAGGFFVDKVLIPLGADTDGSRYLEPDGRFPNHVPNPEDKAAAAAISEAVIESKADFGIIFDTDVDRAAAVDRHGRVLNKNRLIALISAILLEEHPGTTIVTDSVTSNGLAAFIAEKGGVHHRFKRGYKNVINESIRLNNEGTDSQLAMETSGHGALKENYFLDDGAYLMVKLLIKLAIEKDRLFDLIATLPEPKEEKEVRMNILVDDFKSYGQMVIEELGKFVAETDGLTLAPTNYEGLRVNTDKDHGDGWFLLRMSLHDPLLPLNIESDSEGGVEKAVEIIKGFLSRFDKLDLSGFNK
ncbi:MAG: phosphomannomutase/phosphoglucomutase [Clostridiales bacterium]|nr:phosphomannomutase/phosphoglucomutase [Clostridiales bacterium]